MHVYNSIERIMVDEKFLLALTNANQLSEIEELSLNGLNLGDNDIVPDIFNQLTALTEINLSGNNLTCIPNKIVLPSLQYLDISNNQLCDVTWLERFPDIKDLDIANNTALTIDDSYKIMFLLEKLQFLDGKRVEDKEKIGNKYTVGLIERMQCLWDEKFAIKWKCVKTEKQKTSFTKDFLNIAKQIKLGPNSLKGYRKWRVENIFDTFLKEKLINPDFNFENMLFNDHISSKVSNGFELGKRKFNSFDNDSLTIKVSKSSELRQHDKLFQPITFLQCHSQDDGADDFTTQVWCCMFEPNANNPSETTNKVATCGGSTVCIIDCETLKADARFEQTNEEFYTLAWTSVCLGPQNTNLLVAGGCLGFLHLIHPEQAICYGRIKTHCSAVQTIRFLHSTQLISAEKNGVIHLIDIDVPTIPGYKFQWKKLVTFSGLECAPLRLMVKADHLFCGTEIGLFVWKEKQLLELADKSVAAKFAAILSELKFPNVTGQTMVDAIDMLSDDLVATKCPEQGCIFVWKYSDMINQLVAKKSKPEKIKVSLFAKLTWSSTRQCYINFTVCRTHNALLIGDDIGNLWVYYVSDLLKKHSKRGILVPPQVIVPFPQCSRNHGPNSVKLSQKTIFNDVSCSADLRHIVVACDNNLVGIYFKKMSEISIICD